MPFTGSYMRYRIGTDDWRGSTYCQTNTSASDYGTCYDVTDKVYFVQTDTTTYPVGSLPCEKAGNCIRFTTARWTYQFTIADYSAVRKQVLLYFIRSKHFTNVLPLKCGSLLIGTESIYDIDNLFPPVTIASTAIDSRIAAEGRCDVYDPITNSIFRIQPSTNGHRVDMEYYPNVFGTKIIGAFYNALNNNTFFALVAFISFAVEASPMLIMPIDYERYLVFNELKSAVGWAADGVSQYGWNADDIIRVLRELFPDRAWAVFDDRRYMLYLYNLTPDYVPDWLIDKLSPTAMKVLKAPSDASVAEYWLDELNRRNGYNQTPVKTV